MLGNILRFFRSKPRPARRERPLEDAPVLKLGLALSSGGARGLAHVGVLQVLEENNIEVHAISGSSMGAYIGALWAVGFSGKALEELAEEMQDRRQLWKLADPMFPPMKGLFHGLKARAHLERSLGDVCFEDLKRQLLVVTLDIDTKERLIRRSGKIADAVHASCAMPGIIAPVMLDGHRCVDGGVIDPVPVGALQRYSDVDRILAVSTIPTFQDVDEGLCRAEETADIRLWKRLGIALNSNLNFMARGNMIDTFRQSIRAAQIRLAHESCKRADFCLRPEHFFAPWHDYAGFRRYIEAGRAATLQHLEEIRALVRPTLQVHETPSVQPMVGHDVA
ncbi:patatin-like phospholipase family protein [Luteolibacter flavescens]|uniref:Patatin-like phospholipase family protein n=1 Tax=Luteolibacter flavescens TaxID=1859460 RepID=A0ABT3FIM9_9BACT|nr:patatin-like phospholipase family protein [Luteolibacter flavescens]MCW1883428.1 patatin-like phospholipase family protein [Luteolibacter flavescens]